MRADFEYLLKLAKEVKAVADEEEDSITSAKMDGILEGRVKNIWMLKQWSE